MKSSSNIFSFILFTLLTVSATAQSPLRNKKTFERSLATIINNAADNFDYLKGKVVKNRNPAFTGKQYVLNLLLPGTDEAFIVSGKNSTRVYIQVSSFDDFEDAFDLYTHLIQQTSEALHKRLYFCTDTTDLTITNKETKAGLKTMSGFFEPNVFISLIRQDEKYLLTIQVDGGLPLMYSQILKGQTGQSMLFRFEFNKLKDRFINSETNQCGELPGYYCKTEQKVCDRAIYTKELTDEPNAKYEFSNLFTEVKSALKEEFVYRQLQPDKTNLLSVEFISKNEVCGKEKRKILLQLVKKSKDEYHLQLIFQSRPISPIL